MVRKTNILKPSETVLRAYSKYKTHLCTKVQEERQGSVVRTQTDLPELSSIQPPLTECSLCDLDEMPLRIQGPTQAVLAQFCKLVVLCPEMQTGKTSGYCPPLHVRSARLLKWGCHSERPGSLKRETTRHWQGSSNKWTAEFLAAIMGARRQGANTFKNKKTFEERIVYSAMLCFKKWRHINTFPGENSDFVAS